MVSNSFKFLHFGTNTIIVGTSTMNGIVYVGAHKHYTAFFHVLLNLLLKNLLAALKYLLLFFTLLIDIFVMHVEEN